MNYNQDQKQDRRTLLWAALAVLAILNVVLFYFYYQERQNNRDKDTIIAAKTDEVLSTKNKLDSISVQLDAKIAEIQQLGGSVDSLIVLKQELDRDRQTLRNSNAFSAKKYEDKIRNYESILTRKDTEIAQLKEELGIVTAKNEELSQAVSGLEGDKQLLADSVTNYAVQNRELNEKVTIASALRAENITVNALSSKGKERDGGSYKARRIDKLRIDFRLGPNAVAKQDRKEVYLRILDPDGAVLSDMATGSGAFIHNGREMIYSSKEAINFNNTSQNMGIMYGRGGIPFKDGKYAVELYSEGFKIGQGDFTVK